MLNLDELKKIINNARLPFITGEKVYFVYTGKSNQKIELVGDMNYWMRGVDILNELSSSGIYYIEKIFPLNARLEYKFVVNGEYILDGKNFKKISGIISENSVLEMPGFRQQIEFKPNFNFKESIEKEFELNSRYLKYTKKIKILLPYNFDKTKKYKSIIFNDGYNYYRYADIKKIFDYVVNKNEIENFIIILINSNNEEKKQEYDLNDDYSYFVLEELIKLLETEYNIENKSGAVILAGCFTGAYQSLYTAIKSNKLISRLILQSLTTEYNNKSIFEYISVDKLNSMDIYISFGIYEKYIADLNLVYLNECFIEYLEHNNIKHHSVKYNQGHNWTMWRGDLLNSLLYHLK